MRFSPRLRLLLALLGLICLVVAVAALVYALSPGVHLRQLFPLPPDLFQTP